MRVFKTGLLTIPLHHQTLSSASKEHWASVTGKYNEEFGYYFVDHTSLRLTEKTMPDQGERKTMRHHFSPFHNMEQYIQQNVHECEESMIEISRLMLAQNNTREVLRSAYPKLVAEFSKNPRAISPLIIARHARTHWAKGETSAMRADCNQADPNSAQSLSMLVMIWSEEHNHALVNVLLLADPRPRQHLEIPLSQQGVDLVRSAWREVSYSQAERFNTSFAAMTIDVANELLKNNSVKAMAEQDDWTIAIDENDREDVQASFAEILITAVLCGWNDELQPYVPMTRRRAIIRSLRAHSSSLPHASMAA
ncbi:hypothetical protein FOZ61_007264 [Perkinsus olseni]|uniref:Uncharacterized protein n=1 Tax=Perkinsus olseni TaxID=32597 RepID=A0A7J6L9Q7_PEROL|nr:hypothetical protein FOZ61_007264 [Perkinsus olseni]KAF4659106.1 hypothetical protein FOL46_006716 [Perkinsus olseni]